MASNQQLQTLAAAVSRLNTVDSYKLLRKNLGDESLERVFAGELKKIKSLAEFAEQHAATVHDQYVAQACSTLDAIANHMEAQANYSSADYINQRDGFLQAVRTEVEEARHWLPLFAGSAVLERGFLEDEGIRREYERVVSDLKAETESTLARVKEQADKAVDDAKKLADEIESRARKSATRMSVDEAQRQFSDATSELQDKVKKWGRLTIGSVIVLLVLPFAFMLWPLPNGDDWPTALYHTLLRIFVLSAAGAAAATCIRLDRKSVV